MSRKKPDLKVIDGGGTNAAGKPRISVPRASCPAFLRCSQREARAAIRPLLEHVPDYRLRPRVGAHVRTNAAGDFVFGTVATWSPPKGRRCVEVGTHVATEDPAGDDMAEEFFRVIVQRLPEAVLVQWHLDELTRLLSRYAHLEVCQQIAGHLQGALDLHTVFQPFTPEGVAPYLAVLAQRCAQQESSWPPLGEALFEFLAARGAEAWVVEDALEIFCDHAAELRLLSDPRRWVEDWLTSSHPIWLYLLEGDGQHHLHQVKLLDLWVAAEAS